MSNPLQILAGILIVFFLPGFTMVNMLFPRKGELDPEYDIVYRTTLGMGLSIVVAIIVGFALNAISTEEQGYVSAGPLWTVLLLTTAMFFLAGWVRGAYPSLGLIHPSLYRPPRISEVPGSWTSDFAKSRKMDKLILERERNLADIKAFMDRLSTHSEQRKLYYRRRLDQARARVTQINDELQKLKSEEG
jgi:hypothetical protein